jgi:NADH dehydrogenase FAD-containing subunit
VVRQEYRLGHRGPVQKPFRYFDEGIMAMIGRNSAGAEVGEHRHELKACLLSLHNLGFMLRC